MSLIEILVALAISSLCLVIAYGSVMLQMRRQAAQAAVSESQHASRLAFDVLTEQIANAGFGVPQPTSPSAAPTIIAAEPTRLSFWTNTRTYHTYLRTGVTADARQLSVLAATGIAAGGSVYICDDTHWVLRGVQSVSGTTVDLTATLSSSFAAGSLILPIEQVTFAFADGALQRNGHPMLSNVTNLQFTYDSTTAADIRRITIAMTVQSRLADVGGTRRSITLAALVAPPNLTL
jgi:prepilin-type N-terminal cleavage/methylation domain-containing protein